MTNLDTTGAPDAPVAPAAVAPVQPPAPTVPVSGRTIDALISRRKRTTPGRKSHKHPLGDGTHVEVFWDPWTLAEQDQVLGDSEKWRAYKFATILIVKGLKADGTKMFSEEDIAEMLDEVDPSDIKALASPILADLNAKHRDAQAGTIEKK